MAERHADLRATIERLMNLRAEYFSDGAGFYVRDDDFRILLRLATDRLDAMEDLSRARAAAFEEAARIADDSCAPDTLDRCCKDAWTHATFELAQRFSALAAKERGA